MDELKQAVAPRTQPFGREAFMESENTIIRWLGNAGAMINARGTTLMIDPLLKGFDLPLLIEIPIDPLDVPHLDAVLITHSDNDHFSRITCEEISGVTEAFHAPHYVAGLMKDIGINCVGHDIRESFQIGPVTITLTPADHAWQNEYPKYKTREFKQEDYCGFWLDTPDGSIWAVGDSRLMPEQLEMPDPNVMLFDFSDSSWHIGFENAVVLANRYPNTDLILWHWGSVDAPTRKEFNGEPEELAKRIVNPERMHALAAGEPFCLKSLK